MYAPPNEQKFERTNLQFGASSLPPSVECRHLGLTIDSRLPLASHVRAVCRSARYHLWRISRFRRSLDLASMKCLVNSLVISRLDYANSLFSGLPEKLLDCLQLVQNAAARLIFAAGRRDDPRALLKQLYWLPIREKIVAKISTIVFRTLNGLAPSYLVDRLSKRIQSRPGLRRRQEDALALELPLARRARYGDRAFSVAGPRIWNSLPDNVKCSSSLGDFKSRLNTYLFSRVYSVNNAK
jgi:hypothetical protein